MWKVLTLFFRHEQMVKTNGLRRVSAHAGVLGCKETAGAKPDSRSILEYLPGEQPFEGILFPAEKELIETKNSTVVSCPP